MLTYMVISTIYTVNPRKSIWLIQMSDNSYKYENFYSLCSMHFKQQPFQETDESLCTADSTETEHILHCCQVLLLYHIFVNCKSHGFYCFLTLHLCAR